MFMIKYREERGAENNDSLFFLACSYGQKTDIVLSYMCSFQIKQIDREAYHVDIDCEGDNEDL